MAQYTHGSVDHPFATSDILLHDDDYGSHAFPDPFVRADLPCFLVLSSEWRYHLVDVSTLPDDDPVVSHPGRPSVCGLGSCSHMRRFDVPPAGALACSTRGFLGLAGVNVPSAEKCWIFLAHLLCILIQSFAGIGTPADAFDASLILDDHRTCGIPTVFPTGRHRSTPILTRMPMYPMSTAFIRDAFCCMPRLLLCFLPLLFGDRRISWATFGTFRFLSCQFCRLHPSLFLQAVCQERRQQEARRQGLKEMFLGQKERQLVCHKYGDRCES
jgi:hypothetical protein